jgi:hypothetical protein
MNRSPAYCAALLSFLLLVAPAVAQEPDPFRSAAPDAVAPKPVPAPRLRATPQPEPELPLPAPLPAPATPPIGYDGDWAVYGTGLGTQTCGNWAVKLTVVRGQVSGTVAVGSGSRTFGNVAVQADGTFRSVTSPGSGVWANQPRQQMPIFSVSGRFSGDKVTVGIEVAGTNCHLPRTGEGRRTGR